MSQNYKIIFRFVKVVQNIVDLFFLGHGVYFARFDSLIFIYLFIYLFIYNESRTIVHIKKYKIKL